MLNLSDIKCENVAFNMSMNTAQKLLVDVEN